MGIESEAPLSPLWKSQKRHLRRDGQLLKYRLGTNVRAKALPTRQNPKSKLTAIRTAQVPLPSYEVVQLSSGEAEDEELHQAPFPQVDNSNVLARTTSSWPSSILKDHIGGLRNDPFNAFPISNRGHVASAFDYCKFKPCEPFAQLMRADLHCSSRRSIRTIRDSRITVSHLFPCTPPR